MQNPIILIIVILYFFYAQFIYLIFFFKYNNDKMFSDFTSIIIALYKINTYVTIELY